MCLNMSIQKRLKHEYETSVGILSEIKFQM